MNTKYNNEETKHTRAKKEKALAVGITILSLVVIMGVGYAFFSASVSNANNESLLTETATMSLRFDDNDNGISGTLNLGQSITKKFTLENTGTIDAYGKINWYNLVNTYTSDSLTWTLEQSTSENGTYTSVGSGKVPTSSTATTAVLKNGLLVPVNTTYYYKLTITLNNLDINQSSDINANMHSKFSLEAGSETIPTIIDVSNDTSVNQSSTDVITKTSPSSGTCTNTLAYDGTSDNNLRYVGANPCNYVTFNGETAGWRIVGLMNNVDNGTNNSETRLELVRSTPLGIYMWDTKGGYDGINNWVQADLKNELNGDYLDTTLTANTDWYAESNREYDYTKGLKAEAQSMIENTKWYLGGGYDYLPSLSTSSAYTYERQNSNSAGFYTWIGKVALLYLSDYGYATGGPNRSSCLGSAFIGYSSACTTNNWINTGIDQYLLTTSSAEDRYVYTIESTGRGGSFYPMDGANVRPVVFLKSNITITGGTGSATNPFTLSIE